MKEEKKFRVRCSIGVNDKIEAARIIAALGALATMAPKNSKFNIGEEPVIEEEKDPKTRVIIEYDGDKGQAIRPLLDAICEFTGLRLDASIQWLEE